MSVSVSVWLCPVQVILMDSTISAYIVSNSVSVSVSVSLSVSVWLCPVQVILIDSTTLMCC